MSHLVPLPYTLTLVRSMPQILDLISDGTLSSVHLKPRRHVGTSLGWWRYPPNKRGHGKCPINMEVFMISWEKHLWGFPLSSLIAGVTLSNMKFLKKNHSGNGLPEAPETQGQSQLKSRGLRRGGETSVGHILKLQN